MKFLLDTHTFLWWNLDDGQLTNQVRELIADMQNEIYLSAVSAWEIAIKAARGRLILPENPSDYVSNRMNLFSFQSLPIHISHALHVYNLPSHHADPFDRLLIAQSQLESLPLLSADKNIALYDVDLIW